MYRWPNATGFDRRFVVCQSRDGLKCVARFLLHAALYGHWKIGQLFERFARLRLGYPHGGEAVPGNRNGVDLVWL